MKTPDIIKEAARKLRNKMTKSEIILWNNIKSGKLGINFLRQKPIYLYTEGSGLDRYIIPDFYNFDRKIIIEVDGSIHYLKEVYILDFEKEKFLNSMGYKIIRIKNEEIENDINNVLQKIKTYIQ
ncbi:MAG: DUF559 domain-containing protein [Candidatus Gracilibacteria bacterium]|nr:DUF559 domain-containing protein [Candidatus Gracilibacteria bacterium]